MKFAYLIIVHNEFEILSHLVSLLDDERNDIYIHFDKKVKSLPRLSSCSSRLFVIPERLDVRWGTVSQIKSEFALWEAARKNGPYDRYILLSGTHLPLKSNDFLSAEYQSHIAEEMVHLWKDDEYEQSFKLKRVHLFHRNFQSSNRFLKAMSQALWRVAIAVQKRFHIFINKSYSFKKSDNWVCLTQKAVDYLCLNKERIISKYKYSFCGDEFFVVSELQEQGDEFRIWDTCNLLYTEFQNDRTRSFPLSELDKLRATDFLFARKFSSSAK